MEPRSGGKLDGSGTKGNADPDGEELSDRL